MRSPRYEMPGWLRDRWVFRVVLAGTLAFGVLFAGLIAQLHRFDALGGGRLTHRLSTDGGPLWLHLLANHYVVRAVSRSGDTLMPLLLVALAVWLSVRSRRWWPVLSSALALLLAVIVLLVGKGMVGSVIDVPELDWSSRAMSGPGITTVVAAGMAAWLLREHVDAATGRALWGLAGAVGLAMAATQLYTGHHAPAVLASVLCGIGVLWLVLGVVGPGIGVVQPRASAS